MVLISDGGKEVIVGLVMTVWASGTKPRPMAIDVPLKNVKCFRAVELFQSAISKSEFHATCNVWRYTSPDVMAILDVTESDLNHGRIELSETSMEAIAVFKGENTFPQASNADKDSAAAKKRKNTLGPQMKKAMKVSKEKESEGTKLAVQEDIVVPSEIRRSEKGRKIIRDVLTRICEVELLRSSGNAPLFHPQTGESTMKTSAGLTFQEFISGAPAMFEAKFVLLRAPEQYGSRVHNDLNLLLKQVRAEPCSRKGLVELMADVAKSLVCPQMKL